MLRYQRLYFTDVLRRFAVLLTLTLCVNESVAAVTADKLSGKPGAWFKSDEGRRVIDNIISWQSIHGGWWKSYDASVTEPPGSKPAIDPRWPVQDQNITGETGSFDNKATYTEARLLARAFGATQEPRYRQAFERGLKFIFDSQYPNGGWPQRFPLENNYGRHITFNDTAMVGVMTLLKDIADAADDFAWIDAETRSQARQAFDRGVACILNCQIRVDGKLTGWCQQHDATTLQPAGARSYELPSISGSESCEIILLLMQLQDPSPRVKESIRAAIEWLERSKITGKRLEKRRDAAGATDVVLVDDPSAEPLWARFYDIETNRPFFCGRDGVKKWSLADIEQERRIGYAWLRPWGAAVLREYEKWSRKHEHSHKAVR